MTHEEKIEELYKEIEKRHSQDIFDTIYYNTNRLEAPLTPIENYMYIALLHILSPWFSSARIYPQRKFSVEGKTYIVDFYIEVEEIYIGPDDKSHISKMNFIVECDGHDYHERTKQQASRDKKRDRDFMGIGLKTFRYTGSEIYNDSIDLVEGLALTIQSDMFDMQRAHFEHVREYNNGR